MSISTDVKESLQRIADIKTKALKEANITVVPHSKEDLYCYTAGDPHLSHLHSVILHKQCFNESTFIQNRLANGLQFREVDHFLVDNIAYCRTKCAHCQKELNPKLAKQVRAQQEEKNTKRSRAYNAWVKKQIMLGKSETCRCKVLGRSCPNKSLSDA